MTVTNEARPQGIAGPKFTVGVKGGFPLTDPYDDVQRLGTYQQTPVENLFLDHASYRNRVEVKGYVVGPTLELFLPFHLSVEADGLYRPISLRESISCRNLPLGPPLDIVPEGPIFPTYPSDSAISRQDSAWEVSLLPKLHVPVPTPLLQPYIAAGPSFRVTSVPILSNKRFTAAAGVDFHTWKLHAGPELRFTHWGGDSYREGSTRLVRSNQNQLELLFGLRF